MKSTEDSPQENDMNILQSVVARLSEHFDTVQVFTTKRSNSSDGTENCQWGSGNWFARYGQVKQWVIKQDEDFREDVRKSNMED